MSFNLPDALTCDEIDEFTSFTFSKLESATDFIEMNSGQLYTQVDAGTDRAYSKGNCFVNRTGIYAVVFSK